MNSKLLFDFSINKEIKTIHVKREFNANLELVGQAWTTAEMLDRWWAPAPLRNQTKYMDFRESGYWLYTMLNENGERIKLNDEEIWAKWSYISIADKKSFTAKDGFCDENGTMNKVYPQNLWETKFVEANNRVLVTITSTFDKLEDLEQTIEMGFKEGFTMGLSQLEELLSDLSTLRK
jgi:uncharacterized protein YndB with AHSA1/START domain